MARAFCTPHADDFLQRVNFLEGVSAMPRSSRSLTLLAAVLTGALSMPLMLPPAAQAQATDTAKSDKKSTAKSGDTKAKTTDSDTKKLTPQQQKMKDCGAKWQAEKKAKNVSGKEAYQKFLSKCLKG
jgi:hypothetical protein